MLNVTHESTDTTTPPPLSAPLFGPARVIRERYYAETALFLEQFITWDFAIVLHVNAVSTNNVPL